MKPDRFAAKKKQKENCQSLRTIQPEFGGKKHLNKDSSTKKIIPSKFLTSIASGA